MMIDLLKNKNEMKISDRLYIKSVNRCRCVKRVGGYFLLACKIFQRGEHKYLYAQNSNYISKPFSERKLWLFDRAKSTVVRAVTDFEKNARKAKNEFEKVEILPLKISLYYKRISKMTYDYLVEMVSESGETEQKFCHGGSVDDMITALLSPRSAQTQTDGNARVTEKILRCSTPQNIDKNPIYISALKIGDCLMQKQVKQKYNIMSAKGRNLISRALGRKILPELPENFNKNYTVDADTIPVLLLRRSGYTVLHRPCFAMQNSTHGKWQLNPHLKSGVDAAPIDAPSVSFAEFAELFG